MPKFNHVSVKLMGQDGNAFLIMGRVTEAMKRAGIDKAEIDAYREAAMSGDYDNLLHLTCDTVNVR